MSERLSEYDYHLPEELIAQQAASPRDRARLLVIHRAEQRWEHRTFRDLPRFLDSKDLLVANNTRVLKARLLGKRILPGEGKDGKEGGKVEFVMLEERGPRTWEGLFHASAKYLPGLEFQVPTPDGRGIRGRLVRGSAESPSGNVVAEFDRDPIEADAGELPLPKYIQRRAPTREDEERYQTIYAKERGSAAAPTAGLHFTDQVLADLRAKGIAWEEITLHVGVGTFRPVKTEDIAAHVMHEEAYRIPSDVAQRISDAKSAGRRIVAVGTTSVRTLESGWSDGRLQSGTRRTSLFIRPGHHRFRVVDRMITNFHLPKSTLLMLVCAFAGRELVLDAYRDAIREKYRFFSFGDAMLIL